MTEADDAKGKSSAAPFVSVQWRSFLLGHSLVFARLQAEREAGWKSAELDQWYAKRWESASGQPAAHSATAAGGTAAPTTHFASASPTELSNRYRVHSQRTWAKSLQQQQQSRKRERGHGGDEDHPHCLTSSTFRFLDLGCAPGGVSRFLVEDLSWSGIGMTLSPQMGGIAMCDSLMACHATSVTLPTGGMETGAEVKPRYLLFYGDVGRPVQEWDLCDPPSGECPWSAANVLVNHRFRFVNGGAVQDFGQRQQISHDATAAILPWFTLLTPQLRLALAHVEEGGSFMLVHGAPHCASMFILVCLLHRALGPSVRIRAFETMHLSKPPIYLLFDRVSVRGEEWQRRQESLLASLDPTSAVIAPDFAVGDHRDEEKEDGKSVTARKRDFWMGESALGFSLAQEGFFKYRHDVETVWARMTDYLKHRRQKALQTKKE